MLASLATPLTAAPRPAAIPATLVPCAHPSTATGQLSPERADTVSVTPSGHTLTLCPTTLDEYQASEMTRPDKKECVFSTPLSMIATVWPLPVEPRFHAAGALTIRTLSAIAT